LQASTGIISQLLTDNTSLQQQVTEAGAQIIQLQTDLTHAHNQNVTTANAYTSAIQSRDNALAAKNAELQDVRTDKDAVIAKLQQQVAELQLQLKFDHMYTEEEAKAFGIVGS
jgi:chromosome segregation ATPase